MKRIRRITMEVIRQRQQLTLSGDAAAMAAHSGAANSAVPDFPPSACPLCGSPWLLLSDPGVANAAAELSDPDAALAALDLHLQGTSAGRLWICRRSLDRLKEKL